MGIHWIGLRDGPWLLSEGLSSKAKIIAQLPGAADVGQALSYDVGLVGRHGNQRWSATPASIRFQEESLRHSADGDLGVPDVCGGGGSVTLSEL